MMEMRFKPTSKVKILSLIGRGVSSCMLRVQLASNNDLHCQDVHHSRKHPWCHSVLWFPREEHAILTHLEKSIKFSLKFTISVHEIFFLVFQACRKIRNITNNLLLDESRTMWGQSKIFCSVVNTQDLNFHFRLYYDFFHIRY